MCVFSECCKNVFLARIQGQISLQATVKVPPLQPPPITKQTSGQQSSSKAVPLLGSLQSISHLYVLFLSLRHMQSHLPRFPHAWVQVTPSIYFFTFSVLKASKQIHEEKLWAWQKAKKK